MNSNSQLPELRDPPPALPPMSDVDYGNTVNAELLPHEEIFRDRRGTGTQHDVAAQAPAARAPAVFPAFQRPQTMKEINLRKRQIEFANLSEQLAKGNITPEVFGQKSALLNLSDEQMDEAGLFLLNQGGKRKSRYLKVNKRRRTRSNKRSNKRSRK